MNRQQKETVVAEFKDMLKGSAATFLVAYKGLNVSKMQALRRKLRDNGGELRVTKARLMKIAADGVDGIGEFEKLFKDQIALVFAKDEVAGVVKALVDFSNKDKVLNVLSGFFDSKVLSKDEINFLASLPSKDVLLATLLATMNAPITSFVRLLNLLIVRLLYVLKRIEEKVKVA